MNAHMQRLGRIAVLTCMAGVAWGSEPSAASQAPAAAAAGSQPASRGAEDAQVWVPVGRIQFNGAVTFLAMWPGEVGAATVQRLESDGLGVFVAQAKSSKERPLRVVFFDGQEKPYVAQFGGVANSGGGGLIGRLTQSPSVRITAFYSPQNCPRGNIRRIHMEQQLPAGDPLAKAWQEAHRMEQEQKRGRESLVRQSPLPVPEAGKPYPFVLSDIHGKAVDGKQLLGKVVVLDFWATWCGPCIAEIPRLKALYERYHDKGLEIISIDMFEEPKCVLAFAETRPVPWPQVALAGPDQEAAKAATGIEAIPAFFVIDRDGKLHNPNATPGTLEETVRDLLIP